MSDSIRKSALSEFCENKNVPVNLRNAFKAYAKTVYADRYLLRGDTDTLTIMINRLTEEQIEAVWKEFLSEMSKVLPPHW